MEIEHHLVDEARLRTGGQTDPCEPVFALRDAGKPIPAEVSLAPLTRGCNQQASQKDTAARRANGCAWIAPEIGNTHLEDAIRQRAGQTAAVPASRTSEQAAPSKPVDIKQTIAANIEARQIESEQFHQQRLKERLARRTPTTADQTRKPWRGPVARIDVASDWGIPLTKIRIPNAEHHRTIGVVLKLNNGYYEIGRRPFLIDGHFSDERTGVSISQSAKSSPALVVGDVVWIGPDDASTLRGTSSVLLGPEG